MSSSEVTREELTVTKIKLIAAGREYKNIQREYQDKLQEYLGIKGNNILVSNAQMILKYAERNHVEIRWFSDKLRQAMLDVQGFSPGGFFDDRLPKAETAEQYYNCAVHIIRSEFSKYKTYYLGQERPEVTSLRLAFQVEKNTENPTDLYRMSTVYGWLRKHITFLWESHDKYGQSRYREKDLCYQIPVTVVPVELAPLVEPEIGSIKNRKALVLVRANGRDGSDLITRLEAFGYDVREKYPPPHDPYEPYYPKDYQVTISGYEFQHYDHAAEYLAALSEKFDQRLLKVLTDSQRANFEIFRRLLNPIRTPLTIGSPGLEYPRFVEGKLIYYQGVDVGFSMPQAARLAEIGLNHNFSPNENKYGESPLGNYLSLAENIRKSVMAGDPNAHAKWPRQFGPGRFSEDFYECLRIVEAQKKLKEQYEQQAYRIYQL